MKIKISFLIYRSEERGLSRKHIIESVKASLQRLQLQYIDIVIIHKADAMCPMEGKYTSWYVVPKININFNVFVLRLQRLYAP